VFKALPRNITFTNKAAPVRRNIPNRKKKTKSAVLPLNGKVRNSNLESGGDVSL